MISLLIPIIIVVVKALMTKSEFYSSFLIRLLIFAAIALSFYMIPTERILEMKNRNFPEYVEAEKNLMQDPHNSELQQKVSEEQKKKHLAN